MQRARGAFLRRLLFSPLTIGSTFIAKQWMCMMDREEIGKKRVQLIEKKNNLQILRKTDSEFLANLESTASSSASPLCWKTWATHSTQILEPLLTKKTFKQGGSVPSNRLHPTLVSSSLPSVRSQSHVSSTSSATQSTLKRNQRRLTNDMWSHQRSCHMDSLPDIVPGSL